MSYTKKTNVTKNSPGYIKSYIKFKVNVTAGALCILGNLGRVTLVTLNLTKHYSNNVHTIYSTIYNNNIKLYIFNVTDVTALYTFKNQLVTGYINDVT